MATFGGSIQQLAGIEANTDAARRANLERMLSAMVDRYHQSQAQNKQFAQQKELQGAAQGERRREFDTQMEANKAHENRLQQYNDTNLGLQKDRLREEQRTRRMQLLDRRRQFTFDDQQKNLRNLLPSAEEMANNGMFENTEDVIKQFPSLAGQAPMLSSRSQAARKMIEAELQSDQQNASLLNEGPAQVGRLRNMATQEQDASWDTDRNHWYRPNQADTGAIAEWGQEATALQGAMDATRRDKSRMQRLAPDAQGRFAPTTVLPWTPRTNQVNRPPVNLPDGSVATVRSIGVGDERGEWVIPTIVNGKPVSDDVAVQLWRSGQNQPLGGPFKTVDESNAFAQKFHESEARRIGVPADRNPAQRSQQFKPGMQVIQNGVNYQFDGQNWVPLR